MTALASDLPWWSSAPNPPCSDFCKDNHPERDFARGGGMSCTKTIVKTDVLEVGINQYRGASVSGAAGEIRTDPVEVYIWVPALDDEFLPPDEAERILEALTRAAAQAIREAREANA